MGRLTAVVGALVVGLIGAGEAQALPRNSGMDVTMRGRGQLTIDDRDEDVRRVSVRLDRDGDAMIRAFTDRGLPINFAGTWSGGRGDDVRLDVRGGFGNSGMSGRGSLNLRRQGGGFDRIDLSGTRNGRRFSLRFTGDSREGGEEDKPFPTRPGRGDNDWPFPSRPGRGEYGDFRGLSETSDGTGRLTLQGRREERLRRATVELKRDGEAVLRFFDRNGDRHTFDGRWYGRRGDDIEVRVSGGFGDTDATLTGIVNLRRAGGFDRVDLRGRAGGRDLTIRFDRD